MSRSQRRKRTPDHRRREIEPRWPDAQLDEDGNQQRCEHVEQRGPMRDIDVNVGPVPIADHDLPVLPHSERQGQQKDGSRRHQRDGGVDPEDVAHRCMESSCAPGFMAFSDVTPSGTAVVMDSACVSTICLNRRSPGKYRRIQLRDELVVREIPTILKERPSCRSRSTNGQTWDSPF